MAGWVIGISIGTIMIVTTKAVPLAMQGSVGLMVGAGVMSFLWWLRSTDPG